MGLLYKCKSLSKDELKNIEATKTCNFVYMIQLFFDIQNKIM